MYIKRSRLNYHSKTGHHSKSGQGRPFEYRTRPVFGSPLYLVFEPPMHILSSQCLPDEIVEALRLMSGSTCCSCQFMWGDPGLSLLDELPTDWTVFPAFFSISLTVTWLISTSGLKLFGSRSGLYSSFKGGRRWAAFSARSATSCNQIN